MQDYLSYAQKSETRIPPRVDRLTIHHSQEVHQVTEYPWTHEEVDKVVKEYLGPQYQSQYYKVYHAYDKECPCCYDRNRDSRQHLEIDEIVGKRKFPYNLDKGKMDEKLKDKEKGETKKPPLKEVMDASCQVDFLLPSYSQYYDVDGFDRYAYRAALTDGSNRSGSHRGSPEVIIRKERSNPAPKHSSGPSKDKDVQTLPMPVQGRPVQHSANKSRNDLSNSKTQLDGKDESSKDSAEQKAAPIQKDPDDVDELSRTEDYEERVEQPYLHFKHGHGVPLDESEYDRGIILASYRYYRAMERLDEHIEHI